MVGCPEETAGNVTTIKPLSDVNVIGAPFCVAEIVNVVELGTVWTL